MVWVARGSALAVTETDLVACHCTAAQVRMATGRPHMASNNHRPAQPQRLTAARRARSLAGKLSIIRDKALRARFEGAQSADEVDALAREFVGAIAGDKCAAPGVASARAGRVPKRARTRTRALCCSDSMRASTRCASSAAAPSYTCACVRCMSGPASALFCLASWLGCSRRRADARPERQSMRRLKGSGWPSSMYGVSKLCESMYTRVLADELRPRNVAVNACCPGCGRAGNMGQPCCSSARGCCAAAGLPRRVLCEAGFVRRRYGHDRVLGICQPVSASG